MGTEAEGKLGDLFALVFARLLEVVHFLGSQDISTIGKFEICATRL